MPDPIPGMTPEKESVPFEELLSRSKNLYDQLGSRPKGEEEINAQNILRKEYVDSLENIYQEYNQEFGQPKGKDPSDYVTSYVKLQRFIN